MDPIDQLHADCLRARDDIRRRFRLLRYHASVWQPRPMPKEFR